MIGYENNYHVMGWYANNWNKVITADQSIKNQGRYYTNHFAIAVRTGVIFILLFCLFLLMLLTKSILIVIIL